MRIQLRRFLLAMLLISTVSIPIVSIAQTEPAINIQKGPGKGQVNVKVLPQEAYIWVNGTPVAHRNSTLYLAPGEYTITIANYGYKSQVQKVTVAAGQSQKIEALLQPAGAPVNGPWGRVQIEGVAGKSPVFVNGTTPEFFVGHVDEMNNNFVTKQQLILPVGNFQLYVMGRGTTEPIWSGKVEVKPSERLIVYLEGNGNNRHARMVYKSWAQASKLKDVKRFDASTASATIAVAPVTGSLAADKTSIQCNQPAKLTWSTENAGKTTLMADNQTIGDTANGNLEVSPKQTTKYVLHTIGPGGEVTKEVTINVDPTVQTSLKASQPEIRFVKVGDTVKEQESTNLDWTASNADSVQIEPIGTVSGTNGSQSVKPVPAKSEAGPVDEMLTYKIVAKNVCGGSDTSTASVHLTGSIEPATVAEVEPPPELPHTASPLPLLALFGLASLGTGAFLKLRSRR
jgi:archaellum component FlaG (FlaF/FlaG flagellin family)